MTLAVYPGTFDPVTRGHLDIIRRACAVFDELVVAVLVNTRKTPLLDAATRAAVIREAVDEELSELAGHVEVTTFEGLTVEFVRQRGASSIVRGLRAVSDFESEQAMAHLNREMAPDVDTVFLMTGLEHAYLSSSMVREIASLGGDISTFVPRAARRCLEGSRDT